MRGESFNLSWASRIALRFAVPEFGENSLPGIHGPIPSMADSASCTASRAALVALRSAARMSASWFSSPFCWSSPPPPAPSAPGGSGTWGSSFSSITSAATPDANPFLAVINLSWCHSPSSPAMVCSLPAHSGYSFCSSGLPREVEARVEIRREPRERLPLLLDALLHQRAPGLGALQVFGPEPVRPHGCSVDEAHHSSQLAWSASMNSLVIPSGSGNSPPQLTHWIRGFQYSSSREQPSSI